MVKRAHTPLKLTPEDRAQLEMWRDGRKRSAGEPPLADCARVILAFAETTDIQAVAAACKVSLSRVINWRKAFLRGGIARLSRLK
jgi:hypothetical protein